MEGNAKGPKWANTLPRRIITWYASHNLSTPESLQIIAGRIALVSRSGNCEQQVHIDGALLFNRAIVSEIPNLDYKMFCLDEFLMSCHLLRAGASHILIPMRYFQQYASGEHDRLRKSILYALHFEAHGCLWEVILLHAINNLFAYWLPATASMDLSGPLYALPNTYKQMCRQIQVFASEVLTATQNAPPVPPSRRSMHSASRRSRKRMVLSNRRANGKAE